MDQTATSQQLAGQLAKFILPGFLQSASHFNTYEYSGTFASTCAPYAIPEALLLAAP
jgi:hypothetical protein